MLVIAKTPRLILYKRMRVKFTKAYKGHLKGTTYECSPNEAFGLIDSGVAIATKDMTPDDYKQAGDKKHGKPFIVRPDLAK